MGTANATLLISNSTAMPHSRLLNLYQEASYTVFPPAQSNSFKGPRALSIRVGKKIDISSQFLESPGKGHLISACNPFSIPLGPEENRIRQEFLGNQLSRAGLVYWPALGHDSCRFWVEPSWLVWNASDEQIEQWMWAWQQLGWLELDIEGFVHLRQLRQSQSK